MKKAFEEILQTEVITDPAGHLLVALGVAILSKKEKEIDFSFDIVENIFKTESHNCPGCPNNCEIITVKRNEHLIDSWGNRCERGKVKIS